MAIFPKEQELLGCCGFLSVRVIDLFHSALVIIDNDPNTFFDTRDLAYFCHLCEPLIVKGVDYNHEFTCFSFILRPAGCSQIDLLVLVGPCSHMAMQAADGLENKLLVGLGFRIGQVYQVPQDFVNIIESISIDTGEQPFVVDRHHGPGFLHW